jgi:hypothetical protein
MPFVEEIPSAQDIKDFDLPFWPDLEKPIERRRTWLADRERNVYLTGVGATGNQAFDDDIKTDASFYIGRKRFNVILEPGAGALSDHDDPYIIHYPALLKIMVYVSADRGMIDVLPETSKSPDVPNPFLQNKSLNEFIELLKEALVAYKAGQIGNKYVTGTITVSFGF